MSVKDRVAFAAVSGGLRSLAAVLLVLLASCGREGPTAALPEVQLAPGRREVHRGIPRERRAACLHGCIRTKDTGRLLRDPARARGRLPQAAGASCRLVRGPR